MPAPGTTVCIVPRERFSVAVEALEALLDDPEAPSRIVYFDGGSPPAVRDALQRLAREHDLTMVRSEAFVVPNAARNSLFGRVATEFTAFLDNDVFVSPGWAPRLEAVAQETGAAVVAPMYGAAVDDLSTARVHLAGGENHFSGEPGRRHHHMEFAHEGADLAELPHLLEAGPTEQAEFHLYFARTSAIAAAGPLDERLRSLQEHLDLSLRITGDGGKIWFEPAVQATYLMGSHLSWADRRYHLLRWSRRWNDTSLHTFCATWGVDPASPSLCQLIRSTSYKRLIAYRPYRSPVGRLQAMAGRDSLPLPDHTVGRAVAWYEERRRTRAPAPKVVNRASWDQHP